MAHPILRLAAGALTALLLSACSGLDSNADAPHRILLITGGGWHDYPAQEPILIDALERELGDIEWAVVHEGDGEPDHHTSVLQQDDWTDGYDLVIHNTGFGRVTDAEFVEQFVEQHYGTPAVLIHSAVHSYRYAEPSTAWFEFSGVQSMWHEEERELTVTNLAPQHPIMRGFPEQWPPPVTEELYVVERL